MIDHMNNPVTNLASSKVFYDKVLATLGLSMVAAPQVKAISNMIGVAKNFRLRSRIFQPSSIPAVDQNQIDKSILDLPHRTARLDNDSNITCRRHRYRLL